MTTTEISRTFRDLSDKHLAEVESASVLSSWAATHGFGWDELLAAKRILIVSEAGVGKTYECRALQQRLWGTGEPAFFLELATLADEDVVDMLSTVERERFEAWLRAQSETATFFLDSIDELKISQKSFGQALKRLGRALAGNLGRARIVITTRPIPIDQQLIEQNLPIPPEREAAGTPESFADTAMQREREKKADKTSDLRRHVALMPLSRDQIHAFALIQGVTDPDALMANIERRHAEEYAQRPQDLIELCSDWKEHRRIRRHSEQVAANVANKLKARTDRSEKEQLSDDRAFEGASRLALATLLTRKLTIRYSAESDGMQFTDAALDAGKILTNWSQHEKDTMLERGLFGFANYGRVRFHHRSVPEYLAAKRLDALLARKIPVKAVKRILFAETAQGDRVVRPSMRPVAAWLSLWNDGIYEEVLKCEPELLLDQGDPESLSATQRSQVLKAYVRRYGKGGWRGRHVPSVQVHRFASPDLGPTVRGVWSDGVENTEVRQLLFEIIAAGKLTDCADIVYGVAMDKKASHGERLDAIDALISLNDPRLSKVSSSIEKSPVKWPTALARSTALRLFPHNLPVARFLAILPRVQEPKRSIGDLSWRLPQTVDEGMLNPADLDALRDGLTNLITGGAEWNTNKFPPAQTKRPDLVPALLSVCIRQFNEDVRTRNLFRSSVLALRFTKEDHINDKAAKALGLHLAEASASEREQAFWDDHAFLETINPAKDGWKRVFMLSHHGGMRLNYDKDHDWVIRRLSDTGKPVFEREMMLWAAMIGLGKPSDDVSKIHESLKQYVFDVPALITIIENRLKPSPVDADMRRLEEQSRRNRLKSELDIAKAHASWVKFWNEIAENPDDVFAEGRAENTAWNLWQAMERSGSNSRAAGWNRRFVEQQFSPDVANRLREILMRMWRKNKPTLRSERPPDKKNTFLVKWQLGLAAIYAEAEDPKWATRLSDGEARLAARFAPIELNGFPSWLDALVAAHPTAVDAILGKEFSLALREAGQGSDPAIYLQDVRHASPAVMALFIPRIKAWLDELKGRKLEVGDPHLASLGQAVDILLQPDDVALRSSLRSTAAANLSKGLEAPEDKIWLPVLMQLDPKAGVRALESGLRKTLPEQRGAGVDWIGTLFGRDRRGTTIDLQRAKFAPDLLLKLVRLAYTHVSPSHHVQHEGSYSPDERDHAEEGRDVVLKALLAASGADAWTAKLAMASDPLFAHFKDRVIALARERAAEEVDGAPLSEADVIELDKHGEVPPATRDEMFAILRDRLDDIDDLLMQDESPREMWASVRDEKMMRRAIARELRIGRNSMYTVDQESATADEKETDIRLRAVRTAQQAIIELKIGEKPRNAAELHSTIKKQLVKKYMAPEECRAGCLMITLASNKTWPHPTKRHRMNFSELIAFLQQEADRITVELAGTVRLTVKGLDLRARLPTERQAKAKARKKKKAEKPVRKENEAKNVTRRRRTSKWPRHGPKKRKLLSRLAPDFPFNGGQNGTDEQSNKSSLVQ